MSELVLESKQDEPAALPVDVPAAADPVPVSADERIAFRGPIQRLLVSPEIGAVIGAVLVWAFFWGNGQTFGTAATTLIVFDAAAPLGIMAVVVALLMIGGEFDLSAGMMTGATGIFVGLMVKYFADTGAPMWMAVGAAFVLAGVIGLFNGTLVNRTGLPSFIVTLATFFVMKGITLVLTKRLAGKVSVSDITTASGYGGFKRFFAYEYKLENFGARDKMFLASAVIGAILVTVGLCEQSFVRRADAAGRKSSSLPVGLVGVAMAALAFVMLHRTDGVSNNALWGIVGAIGVIVAVLFLCLHRYTGRASGMAATDRSVTKPVMTSIAIGAGFMVLAFVAPFVFDRSERREILTWFPSWARVVAAVVFAATGVGIALRHAWPRLRERLHWYKPLQVIVVAALTGLILMVAALSFFQLATVQALRAIAMMTFASLGLAMLLRARTQAGRIDRRLQLIVGMTPVLAIVLLAFLIRADSGAVRFRSGLFAAMLLGAVALAANTLLETQLLKRKAPEARADRAGRRFVAAGALIAVVGMGIRIVFTNRAAGSLDTSGGFSVTRMSIVWWIVATLIGAFVLTKTRWGNWIFAVGGNKEAARAIGVPADKVKVGLFVTVSLVGCFVGVMTLMRFDSVQASQGDGLEFIYIIAAVVGGNLMTGGYGSVIGASVGALIIAMSNNGIGSARWNSDGKYAFQGAVLLIAVLVNNVIRRKAQEAR